MAASLSVSEAGSAVTRRPRRLVLGGRSAIDTVGLTAQPNPPADALLDADTDTRSKLEVPGLVIGGANLAMCFELGAGQRCATAQSACLRMTEAIDTVRPAGYGARGFEVGGDLGYVGDCRSLARHDGPFSCGR